MADRPTPFDPLSTPGSISLPMGLRKVSQQLDYIAQLLERISSTLSAINAMGGGRG